MKNFFTAVLLMFAVSAANAQTATDFTANDCNGTSHNLFSKLNSGKVIVICWVMPCASCVGPALTTYNVVNSFQSSHPNTVYMYLVDDYANTACSVLNNWGNNNGIYDVPRFSNAAINMMDYGSAGMPKIVVLGGTSHTVFYNTNNSVNATDIQNAINAALSATGINEGESNFNSLNLYPNPAKGKAEINIDLIKPGNASVQVYNLSGKRIKNIFNGQLIAGENKLSIDLQGFSAGMYLVKVEVEGKSQFLNLNVSR